MTRQYAKHIKELIKSDAKRLQFNFADKDEAKNCLKNVRQCVERNGYDLSVWRVNTIVFVEKI